jgi:hypothetical protein
MEALIAILVLAGLWWAKVNLIGATGTVQAGGSVQITAGNQPTVDPNTPNQSGPIGNTFLSQTQTVQDANGQLIDLPFRPSAAHNGGGVAILYGEVSDANPAGSVGSGVSQIEKINTPEAVHFNPPGGFSRVAVDTNIGGRSAFLGHAIADSHNNLVFAGNIPVQANTPSGPIGGRQLRGVPPVNTGGGVRAGSNQGQPAPAQTGTSGFSAGSPQPTAPTPTQRSLVRQILVRR